MSLSLAREQELVRRAVEGDEQAYEEIIAAYTTPLFRVLARITADAQEAEALVQEAFWRAWRALDRYQFDRPIFPYLVTVAMNVQRDRWRAERHLDERALETAAQDLPDGEEKPEEQVIRQEQIEHLNQAMRSLPAPYRAVLALRYEAGFGYEEIARALNLPVNTVRTHLRRAKQAIRERLEQWNGADG